MCPDAPVLPVFRRFTAALSLLPVLACKDTIAPMSGERYVLRAIGNTALPAQQPSLTPLVLADTLEFGVTSSRWRPSPLARATRRLRDPSGQERTEEWWYTYDATNGSPFAFRALCADGDLARVAAGSASCIDGTATATRSGDELVIAFRVLGTLRYTRVN